jgi:hypothetical protein
MRAKTQRPPEVYQSGPEFLCACLRKAGLCAFARTKKSAASDKLEAGLSAGRRLCENKKIRSVKGKKKVIWWDQNQCNQLQKIRSQGVK